MPLVLILIVVAVGGLCVIGIIAAIAIPGLLRARMAGNEASAISRMRSMVSAQVAWASSHGGRHALPSCLGEPASCGEPQATSYLTPAIARLQPGNGYDFGFVLRPGSADEPVAEATSADGSRAAGAAGTPTDAEVRAELERFSTPDTGGGQAAATARRPPVSAPVDLGGFAYWASPSNPGSSGSRRFCVDETGVVRAYQLDDTWTAPSETHPGCPDSGRPLQ